MDDRSENAVARVIRSMHENLDAPITVTDMADMAMFSKFHFTRIFQQATGMSPSRFLSALRLQEAKHLLSSTAMTVADVSRSVGYHSVSTFSSRFRRSVGCSPTAYRQRGSQVGGSPSGASTNGPTLRGHVRHPPTCHPGKVVVGLFPDPIAQGLPVRQATLPVAGPFALPNVPARSLYLLACAAEAGRERGKAYVATFGPVEVVPGRPVPAVDLWLRPRQLFDPPVLLAHLEEQLLEPSREPPSARDANENDPTAPESAGSSVARGDLSQRQWEILAAVLPPVNPFGRRPRNRRQVLNGILWRTRTGAPWRDIPTRYGPWETCYFLFRAWQRDGTWARIRTLITRDVSTDVG